MGFFSDVVNSFVGAANGASGGRIHRLCRELGWCVDEVEGDRIQLHFNDSQALGGIRKVAIFHGDASLVTFRCLSHAIIPRGQDVPDEVLGYLLMRNCERAIGGWALSVRDRSAAFPLDYTALGDALDAPALKFICDELVREVSAFDARMRAAGLLR